MFPRWYLLDEQTLKYQQVLVEADAQRRDENISLMHRDMRLREERKREAYDAHDLLARAQQAEAMMEEQRLNEEIATKMSLAGLYQNVLLAGEKLDRKRDKREAAFDQLVKEETARMLDLVRKKEPRKKKKTLFPGV